MSTMNLPDPLAGALFSQSQVALLALLLGHPDERYYLRQIVELTGLGVGQVQRESEKLTRAGIIERSILGRHVFFQANPRCPIFSELRGIVTKTAGAGGVLRAALVPLAARIRVAFVFGSIARGEERQASDVDVMVIGDASFKEVVDATGAATRTLLREINPTVYRTREFQAKLAAGHHFLNAVAEGPKLFLVGGAEEFRNLCKERVDQRSRHLGGRDSTLVRAGRP